MAQIIDHCNKHIWDWQDFDHQCEQIVKEFKEIHPEASHWILGLKVIHTRLEGDSKQMIK